MFFFLIKGFISIWFFFEIKYFIWIQKIMAFISITSFSSKYVLLDNKWLSVKRILHKKHVSLSYKGFYFNQKSFDMKDFIWIKSNEAFILIKSFSRKDVLLDNKWFSFMGVLHKQNVFLQDKCLYFNQNSFEIKDIIWIKSNKDCYFNKEP